MNMDAARRISRARVKLLLHRPFWGHLAIYLEPVADATIARGTMGSNGSKLFYDPATVDTWTDDELAGVVAHEVGHCAFGHLWRRGNREFLIWNYATDYALNLLLDKEGFTLSSNALLDHQYDGMSAEAIYSQLLDQAKQQLATLDDPRVWQEATSGQQGETGQDRQQSDSQDNTGSNAPATPQIWRQRVAQAAVAARMAGKLPAHIAALVEDVLAPRLHWRELLREFIQQTKTDDYRICPPNKKFLWMPIYLPSLTGEHLEIVVAIDTSGSTVPVRRRFASEVEAILQQFSAWKVHLFMCDAAVDAYHDMSSDEGLDWSKLVRDFYGGGGTDFRPVFEQIEDRGLADQISCLVYLTDLEGRFPDFAPSYPVLWAATTELEVPFGSRILIKEND